MFVPLASSGHIQLWSVILENTQPKPCLAGVASLSASPIHHYHKQLQLPRGAPSPALQEREDQNKPWMYQPTLGTPPAQTFVVRRKWSVMLNYFLGIMEEAQVCADWEPAAAPPGGELSMHFQLWARQHSHGNFSLDTRWSPQNENSRRFFQLCYCARRFVGNSMG